ncbi:MAG: CheR family methyltransferase [Oscillospiraceae bacterium]|jgi:chemotaxis protein methyltransferase CheR
MKIAEQDFNRLKDFMLNNYGLNFENKTALIEGRLSNLILKMGFSNFHEYVESVLKRPTEEKLSILVSKLTTNYTMFMREPRHYEFLTSNVLPEICPKVRNGELRIWSAGCSSGEEPYTIAITLLKYFESNNKTCLTRILATDISDNVLNAARAGVYSQSQLRDLDQLTKNRFFTKQEGDRYQVVEELRKMVRFEKFNLIHPFKAGRYHIIFCRNVMIYFKNETKQALAQKFYEHLEPGGYLFIGLSETLHNIETRFEFVKPAVYRKPL